MRISKIQYQYHLCGNQLKAVSEVKDLGIYITSNLSWSMQTNKCANKANSVLGFIRRVVGPNNTELFSKLYKSLVRPILEYCSPVWCPHLKKDSNTLEKIQRRASIHWPNTLNTYIWIPYVVFYRKIHCLTSEFHVKFHAKNRYRTNREAMSAISVFQSEI